MPTFEAVDWDLLIRSLFALGIGGLIGLERERQRSDASRTIYAGIRTLPLVALAGVILTWLSETSAWMVAIGALVFGALALLITWERRDQREAGLTTPVVFFVTYLLGVLAGHGRLVTAAALGIATVVLLLERQPLHRFASVVTVPEIRSAILFLIAAVVVLPWAPTDPIDPWGAFVPHTFVLIVVVVSSVSFLGFLAMRTFGASRGMVASGVLAGLVDSDAAAGAVAALAKDHPGLHRVAVRAGLLAESTSFVRNAVIAVIADPSLGLLWRVLPALALMSAVTVFWAWWKTRGGDAGGEEVPRMKSPFAVGPALRFAVIFAAITFAAAGLQRIPGAGSWAVYLTAAGGFVSSAAVYASMGASVATGTLGVQTAAAVALLGGAASAVVKPFLVGSVYPPVGKAMVSPSMIAAGVSLAAAVLVALL